MEWLLCSQTIQGNIKYITPELSNPTYMPYKKFLHYIASFRLLNFYDLKDEIDKYTVLLIHPEQHIWEVYKEKRVKEESSFEELVRVNEKRQNTDEPAVIKHKKAKRFINTFSKIKGVLND